MQELPLLLLLLLDVVVDEDDAGDGMVVVVVVFVEAAEVADVVGGLGTSVSEMGTDTGAETGELPESPSLLWGNREGA